MSIRYTLKHESEISFLVEFEELGLIEILDIHGNVVTLNVLQDREAGKKKICSRKQKPTLQ